MSAYSVGPLRETYGQFPVHEETFVVDPDDFTEFRAAARTDALGGARAVVTHGEAMLLVQNRGEAPAWDAVGGAREPGEAPTDTVRREVREEVGLDPDLGPVVGANRLTFAGKTGATVTGLWPYFRARASTTELTVQDDELVDAGWFSSPPSPLDDLGAPVIRDAFEADEDGL